MPKIAAGSNATVALTAGQVVSVSAGGGLVRFEFPSGTVLFEGDGSDQTFGPYSSSGSARITSLIGDVDYSVTTPPGQQGQYVPSNVAITGGTIGGLLVSLLNDVAAGNGGKYKVVSGVIRNFNDGQGWRLITNSDAVDHEALNIDSVTSDTTQIYVNYPGIAATKIVGFVCIPDETLGAGAGFQMGPSVSKTQAVIKISKYSEIADYVSYSGSAWSATQGNFNTFSFSAGTLTMNHTAVQTTDKGIVASATPRDETYDVALGSCSATQTQLKFINRATGALVTTPDANMKAFVSRGEKLYPIDPSTVSEATYPGGNIWLLGIFRTN